jgi:hypothetical protein
MIEELSAEVASQIESKGWAKISHTGPIPLRDRLNDIARTLGTPVGGRSRGTVVESLKPVERCHANPRSLSGLHATGAFPLHSDTAHWITPCRFIVLGCLNPGDASRATLILDSKTIPFEADVINQLFTEPFRVINGRVSFFSTVLSRKREFLRLDSGCMKPIRPRGLDLLRLFSSGKWTERTRRHVWKGNDILILDNWRVIHGREPASTRDSNRELLRILVQ